MVFLDHIVSSNSVMVDPKNILSSYILGGVKVPTKENLETFQVLVVYRRAFHKWSHRLQRVLM